MERMTAAQLTPEQRQAIMKRLQPTTGCLFRLANRMHQLGWSEEDAAYQRAWQAHEAFVDLNMARRVAATHRECGAATRAVAGG